MNVEGVLINGTICVFKDVQDYMIDGNGFYKFITKCGDITLINPETLEHITIEKDK